MEYKFNVQLTTGTIFNFLFFNAYTSSGPLLSLALAAILIFFGIFKGGMLYCFFGVMFLITAPFVLLVRAFRDVHRKNSPYKEPIQYVFTDKNVKISQYGKEITHNWKTFTDALVTPAGISLYTETSAYILPGKDIASHRRELIELMDQNTIVRKILVK